MTDHKPGILVRTSYDVTNMPGLFTISPDQKTLYLRMPKNASTSISQMLAHQGWQEISHKQINLYPAAHLFSVLRHPVERFFSAFCNLIEDPLKLQVFSNQIRMRQGRTIPELDFHLCPQNQVLRKLHIQPEQISLFRYNPAILTDVQHWLNMPATPQQILNSSSRSQTEFTPSQINQITQMYSADIRFYHKVQYINQ